MKPIPLPTSGGMQRVTIDTLLKWSLGMVDYLRSLEADINTPGPKIVQLEYRKSGAKATKNGLMMWDAVGKQVVVAKDGAWYPVTMGGTPV